MVGKCNLPLLYTGVIRHLDGDFDTETALEAREGMKYEICATPNKQMVMARLRCRIPMFFRYRSCEDKGGPLTLRGADISNDRIETARMCCWKVHFTLEILVEMLLKISHCVMRASPRSGKV